MLPDRPLSARRRRAQPLADLVGKCLDEAAKRRGFVSADLFAGWDDIVGEPFAGLTAPERIAWPKRVADGGELAAEPATLYVRCAGPAAIFVQHEARLLVDRVNAHLGWAAIGAVRIIQRPLPEKRRPPQKLPARLDEPAEAALATRLDGIADAGLREALAKLGRAMTVRTPAPARKPGLPPPTEPHTKS